VKFGVRITRSLKTPRTYAASGPWVYGSKLYPPEPEITPYEKIDWSIIKNVVSECEKLGYDLITVPDHMILGRDRLEAWTTLSALSSITTRLRLGTMVLCNEYRHPTVLAKMGATLDFISNGRLDLLYYIHENERAR
jgi:alkanesulfonate monooxygenase SsuD/methylene tetrahydromethanopterin reductase-like flavin-dependent oxidoreductase (luciferase family)